MRATVRRLRDAALRHAGPSAAVLTYHRVTDLAFDPQLLAVSPAHFAEQLDVLAERYRVVPLTQLVRELTEKRLVAGTVALTFDDGYADNLNSAEPLLASCSLPATVFVSSGCIESGTEFWWDELERLLLGDAELPQALSLEAGTARYDTRVNPGAVRPVDATWNVLMPETSERQRLYRETSAFLRPLPAACRAAALGQLRAALGAPAETRESHRPLTVREVSAIDASAAFDVGGHSRDHDVLALRTPQEQRTAILSDKDALEEWCGRRLELFSYPFGGPQDFTDETTRLAASAGYTGACANHPGLVKSWTAAFSLPRFVVRDWGGAEFARRIGAWLGPGTSGRSGS